MRVVKIVGIALGVCVALFIGVALFLPSAADVERSVVVDAPAATVFEYAADLRNWEEWSPWRAQDDSMALTYSDPATGPGAWYEWTSDHSGTGRGKVIAFEPPHRIDFEIEFDGHGRALGWLHLTEEDGGTRAAWGFSYDAGWNLPGRYFASFADALVGDSLERGLQTFKDKVEARAAAAVIAVPAPVAAADGAAADEVPGAADSDTAAGADASDAGAD